MMHFVSKGKGYVAVVTAANPIRAADLVVKMFKDAGLPVVAMEVMEFDPSVEGGVLLCPEDEPKKEPPAVGFLNLN